MGVKDKEIEEALYQFKGNISLVATALGYSREGIYSRIRGNARLEAAREAAEERRLDLYEAAIDKAALGGDVGAMKYVLSTRGRKRGYGEKAELQLSGGVQVVVGEEFRDI